MNFNDLYFQASGIAYQRGLNFFDDVMPRDRARKLYSGSLKAKGFKWVAAKFVNWLVCVAGREERKSSVYEIPKCGADCKYRMKYFSLPLQRNALRVEIMQPCDRCGWNLKPGRVGGHPDDYYPCAN